MDPLKRLIERSGVTISFGVKHFVSASFDGAPEEFYEFVIVPDRGVEASQDRSYNFSSLPVWMIHKERP